jgi:hypothetical protein
MAAVEDALVVRMEATLTRFENQLARARKTASDTAVSVENRFTQMNSKMAESSTRAASSFGKFLNVSGGGRFVLSNTAAQLGDIAVQLEGGTAASRVLGQQLPQILGGFSALGGVLGIVAPLLGTIAAVGIPLAAYLLTAGDNADKASEKIKTFSDRIDDTKAALGRLNDVSLALGEEGLDQLRERYGAISKAVLELANALTDLEKQAALTSLNTTIGELFTGGDIDTEMQKVFGPVGEALVTAGQDAIDEAAKQLNLAETDVANTIAAGLVPNPGQLALVEQLRQEYSALLGDLANAPQIAEQLTVPVETLERIKELQTNIESAAAAGDFAALNMALAEMRNLLLQSGLTLDNEVVQRLIAAEDTARQMAARFDDAAAGAASVGAAAGGMAGPINAAAGAAAKLANELGRAFENASLLASRNVGEIARQKIMTDTVGKPVERAARLAAAEFDSQVNSGVDQGLQRAMGVPAMRSRAIGNAAELAEEQERTTAAERAFAASQRASSGGGSSGGAGGGGGGTDKLQSIIDLGDKQIEQMQIRLQLLGQTGVSTEELQAKQQLLNAAQAAGIDVDTQLAESGATLREVIDQKAKEIGDLAKELENVEARAELFKQVTDDLATGLGNAFLDAVTGVESFGDAARKVFADLLMQLAQMIVKQTLFNAIARMTGQPMQGGGILGAIPFLRLPGMSEGGYTGAGSKMTPAAIAHKGEYIFDKDATDKIGVANLEALRMGRIGADIASGMGALRSGGSGSGGAGARMSGEVPTPIEVYPVLDERGLSSIIGRPNVRQVIIELVEREGFRRG